ncbi:WD40 repeat domain-containing protein [Fimbriiglobus ruber]|nr:PQQ-binding-like beta-propeller repeat protein [Fimbriiglobus ruber]
MADLYGDTLPEGAVARFGCVRFRHGEEVEAVAYAPDGTTIASGGADRIALWEAATGKPKTSFSLRPYLPPLPEWAADPLANRGYIQGLAFTPDGRQLISLVEPSGENPVAGRLILWDLTGSRLPKVIECDRVGGVYCPMSMAVSPSGRIVAVGTRGYVRIVDTEKQQLVWVEEIKDVRALSFAPDGKALAVATPERVILVDTTTGKTVAQIPADHADQIAFDPSGTSIWLGREGEEQWNPSAKPGTLRRWDLRTGSVARTYDTVPGGTYSLVASPDGKTLAFSGAGRRAIIWDTAAGKAVARIKSNSQSIRLAYAPDGKMLALTEGMRVRVWDVAARREVHHNETYVEEVSIVATSLDSKLIATADWGGTVQVWDPDSGLEINSWMANHNFRGINAMTFTPDGHSILTFGSGTARRWDVSRGEETVFFKKPKKTMDDSLAISSADCRLFAAHWGNHKTITLYETTTGRSLRELNGHAQAITQMAFSSDARRLISVEAVGSVSINSLTATDDQRWQSLGTSSVRVWDVTTGQTLHTFAVDKPFGRMTVSPDCRVVAVESYQKEEKVTFLGFWDLMTGKEMVGRRIKGAGGAVFSPDGRYLAAKAGNTIRLYEVASGQVVRVFEGAVGSVTGLTITPNGRRLISLHHDGTSLVWDLTRPHEAGVETSKSWEELASKDPATAFRAAGTLAANPAGAMVVLGEKLRPAPKSRTTAALVADMDDPVFSVRDVATRELFWRADRESAELKRILANTRSAEVRLRLDGILQTAPSPWPKLTAEELRQARAVGALEAIGTPDARRLLKALAGGDPYALLTREARVALRRLGEE